MKISIMDARKFCKQINPIFLIKHVSVLRLKMVILLILQFVLNNIISDSVAELGIDRSKHVDTVVDAC